MPLCPDCWGLDIEDHECPKENFPGENKLDWVRNAYKRSAERKWKIYLERLPVRQEIEQITELFEHTKSMVSECADNENQAKNTIEILDIVSRQEVYTNESLVTENLAGLKQKLKLLEESMNDIKPIQFKENAKEKRQFLLKIESQKQLLIESMDRIEISLREIGEFTMYASNEEAESFGKFEKNTPREVKRNDRNTAEDGYSFD